MQQNDDKNLNNDDSLEEIEKTAETRSVRTFIDDIARLEREKKLTKKDISQIDPKIIDKIHRLSETEDKKEDLDKFNQKSKDQSRGKFYSSINKSVSRGQEFIIESKTPGPNRKRVAEKPEDRQFAQDISSSSSPKTEAEAALSILEKMTQNIEPKSFSTEAKHPKSDSATQQETDKPRIDEAKIREAKPEVKREMTPEEKLETQKKSLKEALSAIQDKEEELKTKEAEIKEEKQRVELENKLGKGLEAETERQENELRKQKKDAKTSKERQGWEKKRQSKEDERQQIERKRWNMDQDIENLEKRIKDVKKQGAVFLRKEVSIEAEIQKMTRKQLAIQAKTEKLEIVKKLDDIKKMRAKLETDWKDISDKTKEARDKEDLIDKRKNIIETEIQTLETREHKAVNPIEIHKIEEVRWKKDEELRDSEEEKRITEEQEASLGESLTELEAKSREVLHTEKEMLDKIVELDRIISVAE